jgi:Tfp pilus assembly major pilin PilA
MTRWNVHNQGALILEVLDIAFVVTVSARIAIKSHCQPMVNACVVMSSPALFAS